MKALVLKNVSRIYQINKSKDFYALKNINLSFDSVGLHSIIGKSGSGKSTLLNLISNIDTPSNGKLFLNEKEYSQKKKHLFYQNKVSVVFQQYHLLEDETVLFNVALPLLIKKVSNKKAIAKAKETLKFVNIDTNLYNQKCKDLSGGEKQRVAIARAIIKNPEILICDEPTGALDSDNSILVMNLLKKISKSTLVIVISHNLQLVDDFSDRIVELSDGKVINDYYKNKIESAKIDKDSIRRSHSNWISKISLYNYKKRVKRHLFIIASLTISILMANIVSGFLYGKDTAIKNTCYRQLDFGVGTVSKEEYVSNSGMLKLVKSVRPSFEELQKDAYISSIFEICPNFAAILPQNLNISYDGENIDDVTYNPIYSFDDKHIDNSLLKRGLLPSNDDLSEVIINYSAYKKLKNIIKKDPLNETINISSSIELNYVSEYNEIISDTFTYNVNAKIVGIVDELTYLSSNKIYYSYIAFENYTQEYILSNLSTYYANKITWYDRIMNAEDYSYISSYSYLLFLKDYRYRSYLFDVDIFKDDLSFTSNSLIVSDSLINFLDVAKYALILFLSISLVGAVLITSIVSFTNYSEDQKSSAIISSLGAKNDEIEDMFVRESLLSSFSALIFAFILSIPVSSLINRIIFNRLSIQNLVNIPYLKFLNIPFLFPLIFIFATVLITCLSTLIPIKFSKRHSIKEELQNND